MNRFVLIIIDLLNDFFRDGTLKEKRSKLTQSINYLLRLSRENNVPIIWVRQEFASNMSDAFLRMRKKKLFITIKDTEGCQILPELDFRPSDYVIIKKRYSAFYGTELNEILEDINPAYLILAGVNTHACIRMTAIDAYQRDYEVILAKECVASYDNEHHDISLKYMEENIAKILSNNEILELNF